MHETGVLLMKKDTVADALEGEAESTIADWTMRVNSEADIIGIPMTTADRSAHLPAMFTAFPVASRVIPLP